MKFIVTFDISNQSFDAYTQEQWANQISAWKEELIDWQMEEGDEDLVANMSEEEVVESMYGDEMFFEEFEI